MERRKSIFKKLKAQFYILIFFLLFLALFPICFSICVPIYLFRFIVTMARKVFRRDLGNLINTRSAVIATDNASDNPKWNLCVWITLDGNLDFVQFRQTFLHDIVLETNSKGELVNPEYQQYYAKWLGFLFWKWEKAFDIREHMKYYFENLKGGSYLEKVTTNKELRQIIKGLTSEPFGHEKSPWEFLFIPNFREEDDHSAPAPTTESNKSVLIFRVHHGFCDGYAILWLLLKRLNKVGLERVAKPAKLPKGRGRTWRVLLNRIFSWLRAPYDFMTLMVESKDKNEWHLSQETLERPFNTAFTPRIPLKYIKEIKNGNNVSFTSVIMAALTASIRNSMIERGAKVPRKMTTAVAVPMPGHPDKLRNHFIFSFMSLPVGVSDPKKRLMKIEKNYKKLKQSSVNLFSFLMIPVFGGLFTWMIDWFSFNHFSTVLTSNFPGPAESMHFIAGGNNNKVLDINFSAGMGTGNVGVGFCMMSYAHGMRIIASADKNILPTDEAVEELNVKIEEELKVLRNLHCGNTTV
ncbi:hypothetical protein Fcan01_21460 [Folsomia candida]|uniref:O-acyltransferase WSD1 C-terminal domain-containing protein n=2 Tax=Folsomia candida TaxID=158441 RepID=A0A226DEE7_FOLCA|nr:hypothetical protein Fcan01_21460 [Folsomia candida]